MRISEYYIIINTKISDVTSIVQSWIIEIVGKIEEVTYSFSLLNLMTIVPSFFLVNYDFVDWIGLEFWLIFS